LPVSAQSADDSARADAAAAVQARIERARALAAAHQLAAAANELESVRITATDDAVRNVTSVMLMSIYLEEGNYARAESLLEETFRARAAKRASSVRTYFALAGQAVNGARAHLARYRSFGINVSDAGASVEALGDLARLRSLLERMIAQAKEVIQEDTNAYHSLALLEDLLGIRLSIASDSEDREKWESEYAGARQGLASSQRQVASLRGITSIPSSVTSSTIPARNPSPTSNTTIGTVESNDEKSNRSQSPKEQASRTNHSSPASTDGQSGDAEKHVEPVTISTGLLNPRAAKTFAPSYPQAAKSTGAVGVVKVYVSVNQAGKVVTVFKSEGPDLLKKPAEDAARKWTFNPTLVDGKPAKLTGFIELSFPPE
ncbi:MAG: TonB family protein, partial [Pyrinomonadaceae bacterium]